MKTLQRQDQHPSDSRANANLVTQSSGPASLLNNPTLTRAVAQKVASTAEVASALTPEQPQHVVTPQRLNRTGLPDKLKAGVESLSGHSMDDVRVHYNSSKPAQLQALAYAQGTNIHIGPGQEKHVPHEAWHVVQQKQGRVKPTLQLKGGVAVNDDTGLEKEADVMGRKAIQLKGNSYEGIAQRKLQEKTNATIEKKQTQTFREKSNTIPIQRVVSKVWGIWRSSHDQTRAFATEELAQTFDDEQQALVVEEEVVEDAPIETHYFWNIVNSARNHYGDWGTKYNITSDAALMQRIEDENGSTEPGEQEVYLGNYTFNGVPKGCNILYENTYVGNNCTSRVYHCGPTIGAG